MGCGGCAKRRELALQRSRASHVQPPPLREPRIRCPACGVLHTETEYKNCPFRLQLERQKAREAKLQQRLELQKQQTEADVVSRRGRQIYRQFPDIQVNIPTRRKW